MKTEKFTELIVGVYKLVDKEGYLGNHSNNATILARCLNLQGCIDITSTSCGIGYAAGETLTSTIQVDEYKFFEKVIEESETTPTQPVIAKNINTLAHETNHATENLVRNRSAWSLAQEVLRLREDKLALQEQLLSKAV